MPGNTTEFAPIIEKLPIFIGELFTFLNLLSIVELPNPQSLKSSVAVNILTP
jgi:hypothetical protein